MRVAPPALTLTLAIQSPALLLPQERDNATAVLVPHTTATLTPPLRRRTTKGERGGGVVAGGGGGRKVSNVDEAAPALSRGVEEGGDDNIDDVIDAGEAMDEEGNDGR